MTNMTRMDWALLVALWIIAMTVVASGIKTSQAIYELSERTVMVQCQCR